MAAVSAPLNDPVQETAFSSNRDVSRTPRPPQDDTESALPPPNSNNHAPASASVRLLAPDILRGLLMAFMAMDHNLFAVRSWPHGLGRDSEADGYVVHKWNVPAAILTRELSHFCAPGFILLLGMGIVLLTQSRRRKGWTTEQLAKHITKRGVVLALVAIAFGVLSSGGQLVIMNAVLLALAINYFLVGMLWLGIEEMEGVVANGLDKLLFGRPGSEDEERPLLNGRSPPGADRNTKPTTQKATRISRHLSNILLVVLTVVTLWWNHWLSPDNGHCAQDAHANSPPTPTEPELADLWRFWFYVVVSKRVMSIFPPLAWIAPAILGLLYARVVYLRPKPLSKNCLAAINASIGAVFAALFVLTRLLHFGNLSEDCIRIDDEPLQPGQNQYLQSATAFFYSTKYPPDAAFYFFTFSANFLLLAGIGLLSPAFSTKWLKPLLSFGQSALFYYLAHFFVLMAFGTVLVLIFGHRTDFADPFTGNPESIGLGAFGFFVNWGLTMAAMWPLCNWYGNFKRTKGPDSLWRFF